MSLALVGDVGGTNARFALARGRDLSEPRSLKVAEFAGAAEAVQAYLGEVGAAPDLAVIAAAGPVTGGVVDLTNHAGWRLDAAALAVRLGLGRVRLLNDFEAQAWALDALGPGDMAPIGPPGRPEAEGSAIALGPGTGFGLAALVAGGGARIALTTEGGHAGFAPGSPLEFEIARRLAERFGRTSVERLVSGPGLVNIYAALADIRGTAAGLDAPEAVAAAGLAGDPLASEAVDVFCAALGSVAGDFALALGARRGVYIAGGVAPRIMSRLQAGGFRERFEAKGRMRAYLEAIPTVVVTNGASALVGAARFAALEDGR